MLTLTLRLTCLLLLSAAGSCFSQGKLTSFQQYRIPEKRVFRGIRSVYAKSDSEVVVLGLCKNYSVTLPSSLFLSGKPEAKTDRRDVPFLRIHGNVLYDFLYRSFVDTPFYQQNLQQHTVQTYLSISVRNRYPFNVYLTNRQGNSPYFQNDFNLSLGFDRSNYLHNLRQELLDRITAAAMQASGFESLEEHLKALTEAYRELKTQVDAPDLVGRLLEERERTFGPSHLSMDRPQAQMARLNQRLMHKSAPPYLDTLFTTSGETAQAVDEQTKKLQVLEQEIAHLQFRKDSLQKAVYQQVAATRQKLNKAGNRQLKKWMKEYKVGASGMEGFLSDVKAFGLGRSMVNYSELTAWNVLLTGINLEYNPGYYTAIAAGKVDYGFRDFLGRHKRTRDQNLFLVRFGFGDKDQKALIFSVFTGTRYNYSAAIPDTTTSHVNVVGYSIEGIWRTDPNTGFSAEVAKTTEPITGSLHKNTGLQSLWQLTNAANLAISVKGETLLPGTRTRLSGALKKTGASFQSFSLFTYNTDQLSWHIKIDQPLLHDKVALVAMLRRNDFTNPFTEKTFKSSTVFKSLQLTVRVPKWPMLSAGYYPGTQLYMIEKDRIRETAYYILNGSALHTYRAGSARMISSVIFSHYASKGTDSGFIAYAGKNYVATHNALWTNLQLQGSYSVTDQEQMQFSTTEGGADYSLSGKVKAGASLKYNRVFNGKDYWGSRVQLRMEVGRLGELQVQYEKSFLPTVYRTLYPIETGRVFWTKYF